MMEIQFTFPLETTSKECSFDSDCKNNMTCNASGNCACPKGTYLNESTCVTYGKSMLCCFDIVTNCRMRE